MSKQKNITLRLLSLCLTAILVIICMTVCLVACGENDNSNPDSTGPDHNTDIGNNNNNNTDTPNKPDQDETLENELEKIYNFKDNGNYYTITPKSNDLSGDIAIPENYKNKKVVYGDFAKCNRITSITLPNNAVSIQYLDLSLLPHTLIYVGKSLQCYNGELPQNSTVTVLDGTLSIARNAFYNSTGLSQIIIPDSVTTIDSTALHGTAWYANQPSGIIYAGKVAYSYKGETPSSLVFKDGTTGITSAFFENLFDIQNISFPNSLLNIGHRALEDTAWFQNQPNGVVYAGKVAYTYKGTMPSNTSLTLPVGTIGVAEYAFYNQYELSSVTLPNTLKIIGANAFAATVDVSQEESAKTASETSDGNKLTHLFIPAGVEYIDPNAYVGCKNLETIEVDKNNSVYYSQNNCIIEKATSTLVKGTYKSVIPNDGSIKSIGPGAFAYCPLQGELSIPEGVTSVCMSAFIGNIELTKVILPDSLYNIGMFAFGYCVKLENILLNEGLTEIGDAAFLCTGLKAITIPKSLIKVNGINAFNFSSKLEKITVAEGNHVYYAYNNCLIERDTKTLVVGTNLSVIPDDGSVEIIGDLAFHERSSLKSINIPSSIKKIGQNAFLYCRSLEDVYVDNLKHWCELKPNIAAKNLYVNSELLTDLVIPDEIVAIPDNCFANLDCIRSVTIPYGVKSIGKAAFKNCSNLSQINIANGVTVIDAQAFAECTSLANVSIGGDVTSIGTLAFAGCKNLTTISIPKSVAQLGEAIFVNCDKLTSIIVDKENLHYNSMSSILLNKDATEILFICFATDKITIPESVTHISLTLDRSFLYHDDRLELYFDGSIEQWLNISFNIKEIHIYDHYYDINDCDPFMFKSQIKIIHCSDGDIDGYDNPILPPTKPDPKPDVYYTFNQNITSVDDILTQINQGKIFSFKITLSGYMTEEYFVNDNLLYIDSPNSTTSSQAIIIDGEWIYILADNLGEISAIKVAKSKYEQVASQGMIMLLLQMFGEDMSQGVDNFENHSSYCTFDVNLTNVKISEANNPNSPLPESFANYRQIAVEVNELPEGIF